MEFESVSSSDKRGVKASEVEVTEKSIFERSTSKIRQFSDKLDALGVESTGIQRIPPYERGTYKQFWHVAGLWISAAGGLSSMSSYFLGPMIFELTFNQALVSGLVSMWIGCLFAAYCSIMGPQSGCRQMVTARYLFGWWFVKFICLASIVGVMGWSIVNCVVGGQMLASVSDGKIPIWVGIIIVTVVSLFVAIFGIKQVLRVETLFSVPVITCFLLLYISSSNKFKYVHDFTNETLASETLTGNWLSFFSLCYSITATWGGITADYYILFPEKTPKLNVFLLTFFGIAVPSTFVGVLGLLLASCSMSYEPWNAAYEKYGMGGLLHAGFSRWGGFGKFCVVVLVLSLVSNNIVNTYSAAFSIQLSGVALAKVPRWIWAILCTIVYLVCALVGRNSFSSILGNFLPMIGYWISIYIILLIEENVIFRSWYHHLYTVEFPTEPQVMSQWKLKRLPSQKRQYNWDEWDNADVITRGLAATAAFLVGVAGVVLGMAQTYYVGPIASLIGEYGGDIGMWLGMGFAGIAYPPLRYWELKKFGR
ncbi:unnamed protein product [Kluyveromyces dobzhanskii CBS 2104]|uniref:Vitamin B6 transporter TPN1 n=1 Tax=Kluyveromyces dobzhanskii CBS 2104 TaxID=1427455 RepID=A0A0A8L3U7_9SACH|nr:unnamed protein product [Kluyveromyces dobzhanskii CBS 2104]